VARHSSRPRKEGENKYDNYLFEGRGEHIPSLATEEGRGKPESPSGKEKSGEEVNRLVIEKKGAGGNLGGG